MTTQEKDIQVTRNYSFWRHPIKWWKDRKKIALMNILVNNYWENGGKETVEKATMEAMLYGTTIIKQGAYRSPTE